MKKLYFFTLLFIVIITCSFAQFNETISSDRPGKSIGPFTVGQGIFQIQSGVDNFGNQNSDIRIKERGFINNNVLRYGLTELFEISSQIEYKSEVINQNGSKNSLHGWSAIDVGMRYHIYTGKGIVPNVGFQIRWRIPRVGGDFEIEQWAPRFIFVTSQSLSNKVTLVTNWGGSWNGNNNVPSGNYTFSLIYSINNKIGLFIENYGTLTKSDFDMYLDGGLTYLINNHLQFDIYTGYGANKKLNEYFVSMGISWRTNRK